MTKKIFLLPVLAVAVLFLFNACDDSSTTGPGNGSEESQIETHTVTDLDTEYDGRTSPNGTVYYNLRENSIVEESDSASTEWDVAFSGTTIYTNSGVSGPGNGGAVVLDQSFENTSTAPSSGYNTDTDTLLAIPTGDEDGWYNYTGTDQTPNHTILSIDNKTIVIRTADGNHYAKLHIISWYRGNPDMGTNPPPAEDSGFYTFEYAIQMNGTHELK